MIVYICEYIRRVCYKLLIYIYREVNIIITLHTNIYFYISLIIFNLQFGGAHMTHMQKGVSFSSRFANAV